MQLRKGSSRVFIVTTVIASLLLTACNPNQNTQPSGSSPSPTSSAATASPTPIPASWVRTTDEVAGYRIAHPPEWRVVKASRFGGESSLTSFEPSDFEEPGPVPPSELKVAVVRFLPNSQLQPTPPPADQLADLQMITVAGTDAVRRVTENQGSSITISFSREDHQYLITAIPAGSELIGTFDQMISSFEFVPAISLLVPQAQQRVSSPLQVEGRAPGTWFFEGQLSARLVTTNGRELGRTALTTDSNWMTEQEIPFSGELDFSKPSGVQTAELVISKANPSGLPENNREVRITVQLQ